MADDGKPTALVIWDDEMVEFGEVDIIDWTWWVQCVRGGDVDLDGLRDLRARLVPFDGTGSYVETVDEWIAEVAGA